MSPRDNEVAEQFKDLTFNLSEVLRVLAAPDPLFIANKMIRFLDFRYPSGKRGIHVTGSLLGIENPWSHIAKRLHRNEEDLKTIVNDTVNRRNDIVHRADRGRRDLDGPPQEITYSWALQAVDSIRHVCLCLDELVTAQMAELREQTQVAQETGVA